MKCPFCDNLNTRVIDSRVVAEGEQIRRRRECETCAERFTSYESAELSYPRVIKSDNRREAFNEDKLRKGIVKALEKRPVDMVTIENLIVRLKTRLRATAALEIEAQELGNWIMASLRILDQVAYVRFASVYHNFDNVRAFLEEIQDLENELPAELKEKQLDLLHKGDM